MTNEELSLRTKEQLSDTLKAEMKKKPLAKITVSSLISICNINRNTFYYHFQDVYALLKWTLDKDAAELLKRMDLLVYPEEAINFILDYVDNNRRFLSCAYESLSHEQVKTFFKTEMLGIIRSALEEAEHNLGVRMNDGFRDFVVSFLTEAMAGAIIAYLMEKPDVSREVLSGYIVELCTISLRALITEKGIPE